MTRGKKLPTSPILEALREACRDEAKAVEFFERHRWNDSPACPRCGSLGVYRMTGNDGARNRDYRLRCRDCAKLKKTAMFTVRTETILEETRLPLRAWAFALWSACSSKKGVSALQISRETEISYKSALFLMHRIRAGMAELAPPQLNGTVEVDELFCGGKPRNKGPHNKRGRGTKKVPVVGAVQRGGDVRYSVVRRLTVAEIKAALREHVDQSSRLLTDESNAYTKLGRTFGGGHEVVNHGQREYVRGEVHTNTIEGAFSLIKRGLVGTFHAVSRKHLHRYLSEFQFRYNTRKLDDGQRVVAAIKRCEGKRLTYAEQVAGK